MTMADERLKTDVIETIAEQLGVDVSEITEEMSFIDDLDADSLDLTELIMTLEDRFGMAIADEQAESLKTVGDVISFVYENKEG
jgi:acyl carrier protein